MKSADLERLQSLLAAAKDRDIWREIFGKTAFTVNVPDFDTEPSERDRYVQMVQVHRSVQLSLGNAGMPGVTQLDKRFTLRFEPGDDGKRKPSTSKTLRQVLLQIEHNGKLLFQCVNRSTKGFVTVYYNSCAEGANYQVQEMSKCFAAQVFWILCRKGFEESDVRRLIKGCFDIREQQKVTKSQWLKPARLAVLMGNTTGEEDIIGVAMKSKEYDLMKGLSDAGCREETACIEIWFGHSRTSGEICRALSCLVLAGSGKIETRWVSARWIS